MLNSRLTTVVTPPKWTGRKWPQRMVERPGTSTRVAAAWSPGYMTSSEGANRSSVPRLISAAQSSSKVRG